MQLSIIIVSYNVAAFLEKCLQSVFRATQGMECEVWVVDNHSVDQSVPLVRQKFPNVNLICNTENIGFSAANNQAIIHSKGQYVLLLNPDTIVSEDCFRVCFDYMESHKNAGAVGVKMYDGSGNYLPESKRGFPSPWTSLTKMLRLNELFPSAQLWNSYYLGHLDKESTQEVDVLTGAFMWMRKSVIEEVGMLDDTFFMYGEDIDLSYRIKKAGHQIIYLPTTTIIHYKGESTKKGSINYVRTFYNAMIIFAQKHFTGSRSWWMILILKLGIYFAATVRFISNGIKTIFPIVLDGVLIGSSILIASILWATFYYQDPRYFDPSFYQINIPIYSAIFLSTMWLRGLYYNWFRNTNFIISIIQGLGVILILYALFPLEIRSSRMVIILSAGIYLFFGLLIRLVVKKSKWTKNSLDNKKILLVGESMNSDRTKEVIGRAAPEANIIGTISTDEKYDPTIFINQIQNLEDVVQINKPDEIIFSTQDISFSEITKLMSLLGGTYNYKIASNDSELIVGSTSKNEAGEWYGMEILFQIDTPIQKRNKRIVDLLICLILLFLFPITLLLNLKWTSLLSNFWQVLVGKKTWFGYDIRDTKLNELPKLKEGVLNVHSGIKQLPSSSIIHNRNYLYAKDYAIGKDIEGVLKNFTRLSNTQNGK